MNWTCFSCCTTRSHVLSQYSVLPKEILTWQIKKKKSAENVCSKFAPSQLFLLDWDTSCSHLSFIDIGLEKFVPHFISSYKVLWWFLHLHVSIHPTASQKVKNLDSSTWPWTLQFLILRRSLVDFCFTFNFSLQIGSCFSPAPLIHCKIQVEIIWWWAGQILLQSTTKLWGKKWMLSSYGVF